MFTKKNLFILIGRNVLISFVVVFFTVILIIFLSGQITRISDSIMLNHRLEAELKKRTEIFEELKHNVQIVGTNDIKIENAFIPSDNILEFINILDSLATKNTITQIYHFETPVLSNITAPFPISTISYSNSFETNALTFSNYLKEFDKLPYFTKIDGFSIASHDQLGWMGASSILINAILYTKTTQ